jgi:hypothetical protein
MPLVDIQTVTPNPNEEIALILGTPRNGGRYALLARDADDPESVAAAIRVVLGVVEVPVVLAPAFAAAVVDHIASRYQRDRERALLSCIQCLVEVSLDELPDADQDLLLTSIGRCVPTWQSMVSRFRQSSRCAA